MSQFRLPCFLIFSCFLVASTIQARLFRTVTSYPTGEFPSAAAVADFNNDCISDIASANSNDHNVSVLLGNGNGTFGAATNSKIGAGAADVASADLNGDGKARSRAGGKVYLSGERSFWERRWQHLLPQIDFIDTSTPSAGISRFGHSRPAG